MSFMNDNERTVDRYSFNLGVMDSFCEMVAAGVKTLALSHPFDSEEEREYYAAEVEKLCEKYKIRCFRENMLPVTDLFPAEACKNRYLFLFYRTEDVLKRYRDLKETVRELQESNVPAEGKRLELAREFGRLLSYPEDGIERRIQETMDRYLK